MPKVTRACAPNTGGGVASPVFISRRSCKGSLRCRHTGRFGTLLATIMALMFARESLAKPFSIAEFNSLSERCAPSVAVGTLEAVAMTESGLDPSALHDNTTGAKDVGLSPSRIAQDAAQWVGHGDSVDIGLIQINSMNLSALNLTIQAALDPCTSLAAGAAILNAAYGGGQTSAERQVALLMALSRYNTGSPFRGIMNGYVRRVLANAGKDGVPALDTSPETGSSPDPNMPPSWNVSANGVYAESHGAPWLVAPSEVADSNSPTPR